MNRTPPSLKSKLRSIIEKRDTRAGVMFDSTIQALIVLSLIGFSLETLPSLSPQLRASLSSIELITVLLFTIEYIARLVVSERPLRFAFSFYGLIDLVAIAPFYFVTGLDMRVIRAFRLLRLFKLFRYNKAITRLQKTFVKVREDLILFAATSSIVLYLTAAGIYLFENKAQPEAFASIFHSLWWAVATLTTVGYGDVYPITVGGKIFTFCVLMIGLGIIAIPAGIIASAMSEVRDEEDKED